ncbi:MAG: hypothetical protein JWO10_294 [Microbacteriaceae bacterium]|nr:hypothetical protein [Microbacteriaceae bacterium]
MNAADRSGRVGRVAIALVLAAALTGIGAARAPGAADLCIPLLMQCGGTTTPTPSPAPTLPLPALPLPAIPLPGGVAPVPGVPVAPGTEPPLVAVDDPNAPTFTLPAAQLGGSSISFSGLRAVSLVTVPLADGTRAPVIKLEADSITITDFLLDVRRATGPSLVTNARRMELRGNVQVYVDSLTASLLDGTAISLLAATPPPGQELPPQLLRVNLGLVGVTASSIVFTAPHQVLHE